MGPQDAAHRLHFIIGILEQTHLQYNKLINSFASPHKTLCASLRMRLQHHCTPMVDDGSTLNLGGIGILVSFNRSIWCLQINVRANTNWTNYGYYSGAEAKRSAQAHVHSFMHTILFVFHFPFRSRFRPGLRRISSLRLIQLFDCLRPRPIEWDSSQYLHCTK